MPRTFLATAVAAFFASSSLGCWAYDDEPDLTCPLPNGGSCDADLEYCLFSRGYKMGEPLPGFGPTPFPMAEGYSCQPVPEPCEGSPTCGCIICNGDEECMTNVAELDADSDPCIEGEGGLLLIAAQEE